MAVWRRKAIEMFPELRQQLERRDYPLASLFIFEIGPRLNKAHEEANLEELRRLHGFADWCMRQRAEDIQNAARLSLYWHIFDRKEMVPRVVPWLSPETVARCWPMWERLLSEDELREVRRLLTGRTELRYQELAHLPSKN